MLQQTADIATSQSSSSCPELFYLFRLRCWIFVRHTSLRHKEETDSPMSHLLNSLGTRSNYIPLFFDVCPKVLGKFSLCPWKFGFSQRCDIQALFSGAIHIKMLSEKCPALPSKWKCIPVIAALFFQYNPSIFAHQFIFSLFVFSTLLYLTFPSEEMSHVNFPEQPFI